MKYLKPIIDKISYTRQIDAIIKQWWKRCFWDKLQLILSKPYVGLFASDQRLLEEMFNSAEDDKIVAAIRSGKIRYVGDGFVGSFDAKLSRALTSIGAKYNKRTKTFVIDKLELSLLLRHEIALAELALLAMQKELLGLISSFSIEQALPDLNRLLNVATDVMIDDLDEQAYTTLREAITVRPQIDNVRRQQLKEQYTENIDLSIKKFTDKQTGELRQIVEQYTFYEDNKTPLAKLIADKFDVSMSKANFLAQQETGLLVAEYRQMRYEEVGITRYKWATSHDEKVRDSHKQLDGKIFSFDDPPVTNLKGDRNNPGEDWRCRCIAIPVLDV